MTSLHGLTRFCDVILSTTLTIKFNLSSFLDDDVIGYEKFQTISLYQEKQILKERKRFTIF